MYGSPIYHYDYRPTGGPKPKPMAPVAGPHIRVIDDDHALKVTPPGKHMVYDHQGREIGCYYRYTDQGLNPYRRTEQHKPGWPHPFTTRGLFAQGEYWVNKKGERLRIRDMTLDYCANALRWINDNADQIAGVRYPRSSSLHTALVRRLVSAANDTDRETRPNWDGKAPSLYSR